MTQYRAVPDWTFGRLNYYLEFMHSKNRWRRVPEFVYAWMRGITDERQCSRWCPGRHTVDGRNGQAVLENFAKNWPDIAACFERVRQQHEKYLAEKERDSKAEIIYLK